MAGEPTCPECEGPLVRGTFCRACGWDGEVMERADDRYLDGVDLPQGYGGEEDEDFDYEAVLRREGLAGGEDEDGRGAVPAPARVDGAGLVHLLVAAIVIAFVAVMVLVNSR